STQKTRFEPGQIALLQTFANHAAAAMQRAGLIHQLRAKITQLEAAQVELAKKERFERELELARQVQQSVLPRTFPQISGYQFAARNEPARTVGGDFYDVIVLDEDHFGIAIADVSDKGMPSALYMALTRSLLHAEARRERSPRLLIENVNQLLLELGEPNMFVTVFYGVMEKASKRLTYTRSGHDRPLLAHQGTVSELGGRGVALGLFDPAHFHVTEEAITLAAGDHLLLYTDGLTDIQSPDGSFFGKEALKTLLQSNTDRSPDQLCEQIFAGLHQFQSTADQYDDMTMLLIALD
ncbi:MAG: PP2C family protein-serine/threonine phosphatase, partial [Chloroflexi bacterium]|nr:PP2C family protein-serine/threonine phosphatase [Chloroflexota bacterium]